MLQFVWVQTRYPAMLGRLPALSFPANMLQSFDCSLLNLQFARLTGLTADMLTELWRSCADHCELAVQALVLSVWRVHSIFVVHPVSVRASFRCCGFSTPPPTIKNTRVRLITPVIVLGCRSGVGHCTLVSSWGFEDSLCCIMPQILNLDYNKKLSISQIYTFQGYKFQVCILGHHRNLLCYQWGFKMFSSWWHWVG